MKIKLTSRSAKALGIFAFIIVMLQIYVAMIGQTLMPKQIVIIIEIVLALIIAACLYAIIIFFKKKFREIKELEHHTEV